MSDVRSETESKQAQDKTIKGAGRLKLADLCDAKPDSGRTITNFFTMQMEKKEVKVPIEASEIWQQVKAFTDDKIFRIGSRLFTLIEKFEVVWLDSAPEYFSMLYRIGMKGAWSDKVTGAVTKSEFFNYVRTQVKSYDFIMEYPTFPRMENTFYKRNIEIRRTGQLDKLVSFFKPASVEDREFLKAAFCSLFWGYSHGKKPAFVFDGTDSDSEKNRGIGKTTVIDAMARLIEEKYVDIDHKLQVEDIKKQLLGASSRIVRFDNVKSSKLSSEALENLITSEFIAGHRMYIGQSVMPNFFTYCFTFNDAAFSKDLAQRSVIIRLDRPEYRADWLDRLNAFIDHRREEIIADIGAMLSDESSKPREAITRFAKWEKDVLHRVSEMDGLGQRIKQVQVSVDDDTQFSDEIEELIEVKLGEYETKVVGTEGRIGIDVKNDLVAIKLGVLVEWMKDLIGKAASPRTIRKTILRNRPDRLDKETVMKDGYAYFVWNSNHNPKTSNAWRINSVARHGSDQNFVEEWVIRSR